MEGAHTIRRRLTVWTMAAGLCLAIAASGVAHSASSCQAIDDDRFVQAEVDLLDLFRRINRIQQELPSENFNLAARQRKIGGGVAEILAWVRDETFVLPYDGALRGGIGVLMDRGGSALDRSLLLAGLLEVAGYPVRLARSDLTPEEQQRVVATIAVSSAAPRSSVEPGATGSLAQEFGIEPDQIDQWIAHGQSAGEELEMQIASLRQGQGDALAIHLDSRDTEPPHSWQPVGHWWVQVQDEDGWMDLDPSLPGHMPGDRLGAPASETFTLDSLPDEYFHRLIVRVIAEQAHAGDLIERIALEQVLRPARLHGTPVRLNLQPMGLPTPAQLLSDPGDAERFAQALYSSTEWVPILLVGEEPRFDKSILADGRVEANIGRSAQAEALDEAAGMLRGIGVAGRRTEPATGGPELSAAFLELVVQAPGREVETFRRELMDIIGPGERSRPAAKRQEFEWTDQQRRMRSLQMLSGVEILAQTNWWPASWSVGYLLHGVQKNRLPALGMLQALRRFDHRQMGKALEHMEAAPGGLAVLAFQRHAQSAHPERIALTRINLLTEFERVIHDGTVPMLERGFDIVDNRIEVLGTEGDPRRIRIDQGVLDTILEGLLLDSDEQAVANAGVAHHRSLASGMQWSRLESARDFNMLDPDTAWHLSEAMASGQWVIASDDARPFWWRLDPATGTVLGMGPDGRGQALVEAFLTQLTAMNNAAAAAGMVQTIWECVLTAPSAMGSLCCTIMAAGEWGANTLLGIVTGRAAQVTARANDLSAVYLAALNKIFSDAGGYGVKKTRELLPDPCEGV